MALSTEVSTQPVQNQPWAEQRRTIVITNWLQTRFGSIEMRLMTVTLMGFEAVRTFWIVLHEHRVRGDGKRLVRQMRTAAAEFMRSLLTRYPPMSVDEAFALVQLMIFETHVRHLSWLDQLPDEADKNKQMKKFGHEIEVMKLHETAENSLMSDMRLVTDPRNPITIETVRVGYETQGCYRWLIEHGSRMGKLEALAFIDENHENTAEVVRDAQKAFIEANPEFGWWGGPAATEATREPPNHGWWMHSESEGQWVEEMGNEDVPDETQGMNQ